MEQGTEPSRTSFGKTVNVVDNGGNMRCPNHPEVWLYENMLETEGFCPKCNEWYPLPEPIKEDD